jgi:hypothetical protein
VTARNEDSRGRGRSVFVISWHAVTGSHPA